MGEDCDTEPGKSFALDFSSGDMSQFLYLQSSGSRNQSASNNNTKGDRSDGNLTLREECLAHLSAEVPTSQGASADEGATFASP